MSRYTTAERSAILRGAEDACTTATDLRMILTALRCEADALRSDANGLRRESLRLRGQARAARDARGLPTPS